MLGYNPQYDSWQEEYDNWYDDQFCREYETWLQEVDRRNGILESEGVDLSHQPIEVEELPF